MTAPPGSRPRRWLRGLLLALLLGSPALWVSSSDFRVVVLQWAYPYLDKDRQDWAFKRIRELEERPDVAWRCYAAAANDSAEAWKTVFEACLEKGPFEFRGLEDDMVAALEDPRLAPALRPLIHCLAWHRIKDPRLPSRLRPLLSHPEHGLHAAWSLAINGFPEEALPSLTRALHWPEASLTTSFDYGDMPRATTSALFVLMDLGPAARPALDKIRPWAAPDSSPVKHRALAALWAIEGDRRHLDRVKAIFQERFEARNTDDSPITEIAVTLGRLGEGDDAVRQVIEDWHRSDKDIQIARHFAHLGAVAAPSLPSLRQYLRSPDPALRFEARRIIAAIENDIRGRQE